MFGLVLADVASFADLVTHPGPSTQLVLVNASSVKRDAKPGQGDKLLLNRSYAVNDWTILTSLFLGHQRCSTGVAFLHRGWIMNAPSSEHLCRAPMQAERWDGKSDEA